MKNSVKIMMWTLFAVLSFPTLINAADVKKAEPKPGVIEARFDRIDTNKDEKISLEEFKADMKGVKTFERFDYDEDGFISLEEYKDGGKNPPARTEERTNSRKRTFPAN